MYKKEDIERLIATAKVEDFIPGLHCKPGKSAKTKYANCPGCNDEDALQVTQKTSGTICHCFKCGMTVSNAVDAVIKYKNLKFTEAVEAVANQIGMTIEKEKRTYTSKKVVKKEASFVQKQLEASGLTIDDVTAQVLGDDGEIYSVPTFVKGGYDTQTWNYNRTDDEMLIFYYDLEGNQVKFPSRGSAGRPKEYVRVRWSNPELHLDSKEKPIKYQSPPNAQSKIYFPQYIRSRYKTGEAIEILIVQEGEKKAEKACKHGIPSVAIQGIGNIGNKDTGIIQELQYLVKRCQVKKLVLMLDSDWNELSQNLSANDNVDKRPKSFAAAVRKFRDYVESMKNVNVSVDVYFGHINENEAGDKGIDDLLCNTLKGKEETLWNDMQTAIYSHNGVSTFTNIHKISDISDYKIDEFWHLREPEQFYKIHQDRLEPLKKFRIRNISYIIEEGKLKVATNYDSENELWRVSWDKNDVKKVSFVNRELLRFIAANGFYRIHTKDCEEDSYRFVHVEDSVCKFSGINEIRNFVYQYVEDNCKDEDIKEYYSSKVEYVMSNGKLSLLKMIEDNFEQFDPYTQNFYYNNVVLSVNANGIETAESHGIVWQDKIIKRDFKRIPIFKNIERIVNVNEEVDNFSFELTKEGEKCEFLQFIMNTSNFWAEDQKMDVKAKREFAQHVINKITAIGYLLNDYKFQTELKAVIAMDGQMSEIAQSNGRTGKSLVGMAIAQMIEQCTIDGRNTKNDDDFLYSSVTPRTRNIFLDDVKVNFDFGRFFFAITGDLVVNPKGLARYTIEAAKSPKFYITTNHAINATDRSSMERIIFMSFSDWYNDSHRPVDDFGHAFFTDWSEEQWNLFDNLMVECNMFYLRSIAQGWYRIGQGAVPPPLEDIMQRTLYQQMGSAFAQWAEVYFDPSNAHLNCRETRKQMYDAYHIEFPDSKFGITPNNFKTKLELYCQFKNYDMNVRKPNKKGLSFYDFTNANKEEVFIGTRDVSGGTEYLTISTRNASINQIL